MCDGDLVGGITTFDLVGLLEQAGEQGMKVEEASMSGCRRPLGDAGEERAKHAPSADSWPGGSTADWDEVDEESGE